MFVLVDCVHYNEDFVKSRFCSIHIAVKSRFCSIHIAVILAGLKKTFRYTQDFVKLRGLLNQGSTV